MAEHSVLILDNEPDRRSALARAFAGKATVYCHNGDRRGRVLLSDESGQERPVDVPDAVTLVLRHLGNNGVPTPVENADVVVYHGGTGPGDTRFCELAATAEEDAAVPRSPAGWPEGPVGYLLQRRLAASGPDSGLTGSEAEALIAWAITSNSRGSSPLPSVLQPPRIDTEWQPLLYLCEGYLAVVAGESRGDGPVARALEEMGWRDFSATDVGKEIRASLESVSSATLGAEYWRPGWLPEAQQIAARREEFPGAEAVWALEREVGKLCRTPAAFGDSPTIDATVVAQAYLALRAHLLRER